MVKPINVAYDVSLLGAGYISPRARTGIFRVLEGILLELSSRDGVSIYSMALNKDSTIWDDISSYLYFQNQNPGQIESFFSSYKSQFYLKKIYKNLIVLQKKLISASGPSSVVLYKVGRAIQVIGEKIAMTETTSCHQMKDCQIYHGTYFPLPDICISMKIPRVSTIHDLIPILFPKFVVPKVHQRAVRLLESIDIHKDWIICVSQNTKQDFCSYTGMSPERVFVTPLAAADYFYPVESIRRVQNVLSKYKIPNSPYLLSLCTLEPRKNLDALIYAFSDFIKAYPSININLVLVGVNGWKNSSVFQAAQADVYIKKRIFFTGYVPDEDLAPIYSGALSFLYPSLYEGFGLPPLEAMQCGAPVIVSNSSSMPEVVGDAGILIDPKDKDELGHAIWKLANDAELRSHLSQKSIIRAQQFSWAKCVDKTIEVYKTAINNKG
jgi:glycosyltransferase involved in cell wall biosynthesis